MLKVSAKAALFPAHLTSCDQESDQCDTNNKE